MWTPEVYREKSFNHFQVASLKALHTLWVCCTITDPESSIDSKMHHEKGLETEHTLYFILFWSLSLSDSISIHYLNSSFGYKRENVLHVHSYKRFNDSNLFEVGHLLWNIRTPPLPSFSGANHRLCKLVAYQWPTWNLTSSSKLWPSSIPLFIS